MVCTAGLAACGGNTTAALPDNVHDSTTVLQPGNPPVEKPDEGDNPDDSQSATPPEDIKPDDSVTPPDDNKTDEVATPPDGGEEQFPEQPDEPEKPSEPTEPEIPNEPAEPEVPAEPENPSATALREGAVETVANDGSNYSYTAEDEAYYVVKVAGASADGGLIIGGERAAESASGGYYLYEVFLEKGQTLEYTVEFAGGETGVFKAAGITYVSEDGFSAVSAESQKYFVFCAESDGEYEIMLTVSDSSEECCVGNYYINGVSVSEDFCAYYTCSFSKGQTVVIWTEHKDIEISVYSV